MIDVFDIFRRMSDPDEQVSIEEEAILAEITFEALKLYHRHAQLAQELTAAKDSEISVLRYLRRYLSETSVDVPPVLVRRIGSLHDEFLHELRGRKSGSLADTAEVWPMAWLAASVTAIKERRRGKVWETTARVARLAKIDAGRLKSFRNNVLSNTLSDFTLETYRKSLDHLKNAMTEDEFDSEVERCARVCADYLNNPAKSNT